MASNRYKIEVQQCVKIGKLKLCSSDFRCGFSQGIIQGFSLWSWRTFILKESLEQTMVNKIKCSVLFVFANKTLYQFKLGLYHLVANLVYQINDVVLKYGLQTPLSITILRSRQHGY